MTGALIFMSVALNFVLSWYLVKVLQKNAELTKALADINKITSQFKKPEKKKPEAPKPAVQKSFWNIYRQ